MELGELQKKIDELEHVNNVGQQPKRAVAAAGKGVYQKEEPKLIAQMKKGNQSPTSDTQEPPRVGKVGANFDFQFENSNAAGANSSDEESRGHNENVKYVQFISKNKIKSNNKKKKKVYVQFDKEDLHELISENGTTKYKLSDGTTQAST